MARAAARPASKLAVDHMQAHRVTCPIVGAHQVLRGGEVNGVAPVTSEPRGAPW